MQKVKIQLKVKNLQSPWITKEIMKGSKRNKKFYGQYLKKRTTGSNIAYKLYKNLFESIKQWSKQNYYVKKLLRFKYNSIWAVMKELLVKVKWKSSKLPQKIAVNKVHLFDDKKITHEFNSFFTNVRKNLASKIPNAFTLFQYFVSKL